MFTSKSFLFCYTLSPYLSNYSSRNCGKLRPTFAKNKQDPTEYSKTKQEPILSLRVPNVSLARSAIAVLGLGFIDAGYSGDWSRIGVISRDTEELLKIAAYVVVPLCLFLITSFSNGSKD